MSHWINFLISIYVVYLFLSFSLSLISTLIVLCASSIIYEYVLYDNFYHSKFMPSNSVVKLKSFGNTPLCIGNSLPMDFHPIGISLYFLNQKNYFMPQIIIHIALLKGSIPSLYLIYLSLVGIEIYLSYPSLSHNTQKLVKFL